ncbi:MAG: AAA family ATPase [Thaumarchaeota archaeon]|nr:AAA family ATPase [Candidatus Calditenuaceae archaeon]MDW8186457.1 AAA family ATPase [Nitrososphaerota archaeon]
MKVVMVLGTPGVGKSAVCSELAQRLQVPHLELTELSGNVTEVDPRALSARSSSILKRHGGGVISSHIVFKPRAVRVMKAIVLRRDPLELIEVLRSRGYDEPKVAENVEAEFIGLIYWEAVRKFGRRFVLQLDVTNRELVEVIELAHRAITGERIREEVDWMSDLPDDRLEKLLRYLSSVTLL